MIKINQNIILKYLSIIFLILHYPVVNSAQSVSDFSMFVNVKGNVKYMKEERYSLIERLGSIDSDVLFYRMNTSFYKNGHIQDILFIGNIDTYHFKFSNAGNLIEYLSKYDLYIKNFKTIFKFYYSNSNKILKAQKFTETGHIDNKNLSLDSNYMYKGLLLDASINITRDSSDNYKAINCLGNLDTWGGSDSYVYTYPEIIIFESYFDILTEIRTYLITRNDFDVNTEYVELKDKVVTLGKDLYESYVERNLKVTYQMDSNGNWITCTYKLNEIPIVLIKREITYF